MQSEFNCEDIINKVAGISTNNQWSVLNPILHKLNKNSNNYLAEEQLVVCLTSCPEPKLRQKGIWLQRFSSKSMIICTNPAFGRANQKYGVSRACTCKKDGQGQSKYFNSMAYNAGRHQSNMSSHIATCSMWNPPEAGHLHSWRRDYTKK